MQSHYNQDCAKYRIQCDKCKKENITREMASLFNNVNFRLQYNSYDCMCNFDMLRWHIRHFLSSHGETKCIWYFAVQAYQNQLFSLCKEDFPRVEMWHTLRSWFSFNGLLYSLSLLLKMMLIAKWCSKWWMSLPQGTYKSYLLSAAQNTMWET